MAQSYMSTSLVLRLFCSLLFLVSVFSSRDVIPDVDDATYIQLPSANVTNFGTDGSSSSDVLPEVEGAPPNRDFLILALSWPRSICTVQEVCLVVPRYFTIHGLWGNDINEKCPVIPFNTDLWNGQDALKKDLQTYWVNAKAKSKYEYGTLSIALKFWEYEHTKHAGCTDLAQLEYFRKSLELMKKYDATKVVKAHFPQAISSIMKRVNPTELSGFIKTDLGGVPSMSCSASPACYMQEIKLRVRISDWKVVDYVRPATCNCPNGVLFPINVK